MVEVRRMNLSHEVKYVVLREQQEKRKLSKSEMIMMEVSRVVRSQLQRVQFEQKFQDKDRQVVQNQ